MLIAVVAATIALVLVRQGLDVARNDATRSSARSALQISEDARVSFESDLALDPLFFLDRVHPDEAARVCLPQSTLETPSAYEPGEAWPEVCGTTWTYQEPAVPKQVRVLVTPPSAADPNLHVAYAARVGRSTAGVESDYVAGARDRALVTSGSDLDLADLAGSTLAGVVYANGSITTASTTNSAQAMLVAEAGTQGALEPGQRVAGTPGSPTVRSLVPSPATASSMRAAAGRLVSLACPTSASATATGDGLTDLCLSVGRTIPSMAAPDGVVVPEAASWLLLLDAAGPGTVAAYYSSVEPAATPTCATAATCGLTAAAATQAVARSHPGAANHWTELGIFRVPASGVVATDARTYVGLCGSTQASPDVAACAPVTDAGTPGSAASPVPLKTSLTVVAGTLDVPADLVVWNSVRADVGARLGLVSTGDLVLPYWARGSAATLRVEASVLALGRSQAAPVRSDPAAPGGAVRDPALRAGDLELVGSVAAPDLAVAAPAFARAIVVPSSGLLVRSAPYFGGSSLDWERLDDERLSAIRMNELDLGDAP